MNEAPDYPLEVCELYRSRRDALCRGLQRAGWPVEPPKGTMFVWAEVPERFRDEGSHAFALRLLREAKVAVSPGAGFGPGGEGHVRFALVENEQRIAAGRARHSCRARLGSGDEGRAPARRRHRAGDRGRVPARSRRARARRRARGALLRCSSDPRDGNAASRRHARGLPRRRRRPQGPDRRPGVRRRRDPARAGPAAAARRARRLREPAARARGRRRPSDRARARRRPLLRCPRRPRRRHGLRHVRVPPVAGRADRAPRLRARRIAARQADVGRQGERARDVAHVAAGRARAGRRPIRT